jgi:plastocyanin
MTRRSPWARVARLLAGLVGVVPVLLPLMVVPVLAASAAVTIGDTLDPASLQVPPGTTVTWTNASGDRHRMRTTSGPVEFDSGDMDPGESFSVTLSTVGTYQYVDDRNKELSNYWGTIIVAEAPTPSPKPTPSPRPGTTPAPATPTPAPPPGDILMAGRAFSPTTLTVDAGTAVRWRNNDGREHTVTAADRSFDSGVMAVGATFTKVFSTPGTYRYLCAIHPDMTGTVAVRGSAGATPPTPPPPAATPRPTPVVTPPPGSGTVQVVDFAFNPGSVDVVAGTTITWVNSGAALHTVTAGDGSFDSGLISAGGRYSRRFASPGTYPYLCGLHPSMTGVVRVSGTNGATPPPPAPSSPKPTKPPVAGGELELRDFAFVPSAIRVTPGARVTWVNTGAAPHTVTDRAGTFDSGILARGARYSRTFAAPGTYRLLCSIHPDMHATLAVAAPGASAPPPATPPPVATPAPGSGEVAILDFDYAPQVVNVAVGTTVAWVNGGVAPHTVTAKDGSFDSGFLGTGEAYSRQFTTAGVVEYLCAIHPAMIGTVVVGAASSAAPGTPAAPGASGATGEAAAAPSSAPSGSPPVAAVAGGVTPPADDGSAASFPEGPPTPLSTGSLLRLGLVALLWLAGGLAFVAVIRSVSRAR